MYNTFLTSFKLKHPDLEITSEYTGTNKYIIVRDKLNILYKVLPFNLLNGCKPTIQTALDKKDALQKTLDNKNIPFTIVGDYKNSSTKTLFKDKDGYFFNIKPSKILDGIIPYKSSSLNYFDKIIELANLIHNSKYKYINIKGSSSKARLEIFCSNHGDFLQRVDVHLSGAGCPICSKSEQPTFTFSHWLDTSLKSKVFDSYKVYVLKFYKDKEIFYKIGRTFTTIDKRFINLPYKVDIVKVFESTDSRYIYDLENYLLRIHKSFKYLPKIKFGGRTECFSSLIIESL